MEISGKHLGSAESGYSLLEVLLGMAILVLFAGGLYLSYNTILLSLKTSRVLSTAAVILNERAEFIRNLPYTSIGIIGGIPAGAIAPSQTVSRNGESFDIRITVRNIDDPFDGVLGGTPNDTAPADYKLVDIAAICTTCAQNTSSTITMRAAPAGLETTGNNGSLFVNVFDASGLPISGVNVSVVNASTIPSVNINDVTNNAGVLQLVDAPTSTESYFISASKSGYSSERTYPPGDPGNPYPVKPHATVASGLLTSISFSIDRMSNLALTTSDYFCGGIPNVRYSLSGNKLIGINPDPDLNVKKYSTSSVTDTNGLANIPLEWDTYELSLNDPVYYYEGLLPLGGLTINPYTSVSRRMVARVANPSALGVSVFDALTGAGVGGASVILSGPDTRRSMTGYRAVAETDWSFNKYSAHDGEMDPDSIPGSVVLKVNASGTYPLGSHWLTSNSFDFGSSANTATEIDWAGIAPQGTSVKFQVAANNDNSVWNYLGSDGTASTYYTATGTINAAHANKRYLRYKVFLETQDKNITPEFKSVSFTFTGGCVPLYEVLENGLPQGAYNLEVSAPGYATFQTSTQINAGWQKVIVNI